MIRALVKFDGESFDNILKAYLKNHSSPEGLLYRVANALEPTWTEREDGFDCSDLVATLRRLAKDERARTDAYYLTRPRGGLR